MIKEQLKDFKLTYLSDEKRGLWSILSKFAIKFGKNIVKSFKKAKPIKGGPKAIKGGAIADSTSVSQKSLGTGGKIMSNVWW